MAFCKICFFWLFVSLLSIAGGQSKPELRGLWVTRFEWPDENPELCKKNIVEVFEKMERANFNVAYFQVRGAAEVLYRSSLEPWSPLVGGKDPGFDPLELAIEEAHMRGIELHAYVNPMPLYLCKTGLAPKNPRHLYYRHGPNCEHSWICCDDRGKPMQAQKGDYYYLSPGIPEVQVYLRRVIMDLVCRYDIDGIHLDRIRYPGKQYSHDPTSVQRFLSRGNPDLKEWGDWQREQLDKLVNDLYAEIAVEKPNIVVSCAAWGIYDRHHVKGYQDFSSGYHDYCQDTWGWVQTGSMDLLIPMIYWDMADPKPNYQEMLDDFLQGVGPMHIVPGQRMYGENWPVEENLRQIATTRKRQAIGNVIFSYGSAREKNAFAQIKEKYYQDKVPVPRLPWKQKPEHGIILGTVVDEKGKPVEDAWVSLTPDSQNPLFRKNLVFSRTWTSGADGRFAFLKVPPIPVIISTRYPGAPDCMQRVVVETGKVKQVRITVVGAGEAQKRPFLIVISPDKVETTKAVLHVLGRTDRENKAQIGGVEAKVFSTGAFARDNIPLEFGENRIEVTVKSPAGIEESRIIIAVRKHPVAIATKKTIALAVENFPDLRVGEVIADSANILTGLHYVRLGGPNLAEVPKGTRLRIIGKCGKHWKIRLSASLTGWVSFKDIVLLPNSPAPHGFFTYASVSGNENCDMVKIPMSEPVAYFVHPEIGAQSALTVDFYDSHWAATWLIHKATAKVVDSITGEQIEDDHCCLRISLKSKLWGYWSKRDEKGITIFIKRPPVLATAPDSPVKGLVIALEAGHGGKKNLGAHGLMGTYEKSINAKAVDRLKETLENRGATVVLLRPGDSSPSLAERVKTAKDANADLIISIHANAVGRAGGFLRVSGTSTYYKYRQCRPLATAIYLRMRELGWDDYGVIGNFNYLPLRATFAPAVLIEQAFLSHPGDEARLLSPEYREKQAQAITRGIEDFLEKARE